MVRLAKRYFPTTFTKVTSHGNFPFRPWMFDCDLDLLRLSVDGAFPDSYARYRVGGELEAALRLMRDLRDAGRRSANSLEVEWKYILFEWNDSGREIREVAAAGGRARGPPPLLPHPHPGSVAPIHRPRESL